jgi:hypothetical protein
MQVSDTIECGSRPRQGALVGARVLCAAKEVHVPLLPERVCCWLVRVCSCVVKEVHCMCSSCPRQWVLVGAGWCGESRTRAPSTTREVWLVGAVECSNDSTRTPTIMSRAKPSIPTNRANINVRSCSHSCPLHKLFQHRLIIVGPLVV